MTLKLFLFSFGLVVCSLSPTAFLFAEDRSEWDQTKAEEKVKNVLSIEKTGEKPWDDIAWETDATAAVERARNENKPLFLFLFMKKDVGPPDAPC